MLIFRTILTTIQDTVAKIFEHRRRHPAPLNRYDNLSTLLPAVALLGGGPSLNLCIIQPPFRRAKPWQHLKTKHHLRSQPHQATRILFLLLSVNLLRARHDLRTVLSPSHLHRKTSTNTEQRNRTNRNLSLHGNDDPTRRTRGGGRCTNGVRC